MEAGWYKGIGHESTSELKMNLVHVALEYPLERADDLKGSFWRGICSCMKAHQLLFWWYIINAIHQVLFLVLPTTYTGIILNHFW